MLGLLLFLFAELADLASSLVGMMSGHTVEGNPLLSRDPVAFLLIKVFVIVIAVAAWALSRTLPSWRQDVDAVFAFCAGVLALVALHNLGISQIT